MNQITYGTVCSGIECVGVAVVPLRWKGVFLSEIEPFPSALLSQLWPEIPNLGDMTTLVDRVRQNEVPLCDVLIGGTPCQAFSVAGNQESLDDARGNLTLEFIRLADEIDMARLSRGMEPSIILWENVPGVFSTHDNAFGCFLAGLVGAEDPLPPIGPKGRWSRAGMVRGSKRTAAWRVLDAQYLGVPQRRERVFVVAGAGDGFDPSQILFECEGVRRDSAPRREEGKEVARVTANGAGECSSKRGINLTGAALVGIGAYKTTLPLLRATGGDCHGGSELLIPVFFDCRQTPVNNLDLCGPLDTSPMHAVAYGGGNTSGPIPVATACTTSNQRLDFDTDTFLVRAITGDITHALNTANSGKGCSEDGTGRGVPLVSDGLRVRRLTPRECERLQGLPDDYTHIAWRGKNTSPDGPRYKAIGNGMAVPVIHWICKRIDAYLAKPG